MKVRSSHLHFFVFDISFACVCISQPFVGLAPSPAHVMPCWSVGSSCLRRAAVLPSCLGAVGATGITLSRRSTAWLSAAARVSPGIGPV